MADVFSKAKRSEVMSRIRSSGNRDTELVMVALMRAHGITGWRRGQRLPGRPDFVFRRERVCVFVDGCFWHGCPLHFRRPKSRRAFWDAKIARNKARDRRVARELRASGWRVLRVWEHALRKPGPLLARLRRAIGA
ncbi:MAG TPA: very short patch repair endonuclease [Verrucomicrobiales bacterium]|nr:very short patch repair endonuclease [Verrucomicrobiales bacterium]